MARGGWPRVVGRRWFLPLHSSGTAVGRQRGADDRLDRLDQRYLSLRGEVRRVGLWLPLLPVVPFLLRDNEFGFERELEISSGIFGDFWVTRFVILQQF